MDDECSVVPDRNRTKRRRLRADKSEERAPSSRNNTRGGRSACAYVYGPSHVRQKTQELPLFTEARHVTGCIGMRFPVTVSPIAAAATTARGMRASAASICARGCHRVMDHAIAERTARVWATPAETILLVRLTVFHFESRQKSLDNGASGSTF